jgi:hypothetical protein
MTINKSLWSKLKSFRKVFGTVLLKAKKDHRRSGTIVKIGSRQRKI